MELEGGQLINMAWLKDNLKKDGFTMGGDVGSILMADTTQAGGKMVMHVDTVEEMHIQMVKERKKKIKINKAMQSCRNSYRRIRQSIQSL